MNKIKIFRFMRIKSSTATVPCIVPVEELFNENYHVGGLRLQPQRACGEPWRIGGEALRSTVV